MNSPIRALLIDPHPTMRSAIRRVLEADGFEVCGEAGDAEAGVEAAIARRPDVCLVAVGTPGGGIRAVRDIRTSVPEAAVVMLTRSSSVDDLFDSIRAGAMGYLLKDMDPDRLPNAVRGVMAGEASMPRSLVTALVNELYSRGRERTVTGADGPTQLTAREWDVLDLLAGGMTTGEAAQRLFVSPVTIRRHVSSAVTKLGVTDRDEAVRLVAAQRAAEPPPALTRAPPGPP